MSEGFGTKSSAPMFTAITIFILSDAEDRKIIGTFKLPDLACPVKAVVVGQQDVHQHQLGIVFCKELRNMIEGRRDLRVVAPAFKPVSDGRSDDGIVFND